MFQGCKNHKGYRPVKWVTGVAVVTFLLVQTALAQSRTTITYAMDDGEILETEPDSELEGEGRSPEELERESEEGLPPTESDSESEEDSLPPEEPERGSEEEGQLSSDEEQTGRLSDDEEKSPETEQDIEERKDDESVRGDVIEVEVPLYAPDIVNVVIPCTYQIAFNPYGFPVTLDNGTISDAQILSKNYGIANKSSWDMLVTLTLTVEDLNMGKIRFVNSPEEAETADDDTYAIYLALVPADGSGVKVGDSDVDLHVTGEELSDISMTGAAENAVALHEGTNTVTFKLAKAVYSIKQMGDAFVELISLAPDSTGVTAFTFDGTANKNADWMEVSKGIRISAVYTYEKADGSEEMIEGTGAMISAE